MCITVEARLVGDLVGGHIGGEQQIASIFQAQPITKLYNRGAA